MLEEVAARYHTEILGYGPPMKSLQYLAINPMGKVPAIVHEGRVVTECAAICAYLAEAFPGAGLAPANADERARYYRWLFFAAGRLEAALTNKLVFKGEPDAQQQMMLGYGNYHAVIDNLLQAVTARHYLAGQRFTAADVYVGAHIGWGMQTGSIEQRPEFAEYFARVSDRDAYRRAGELDDALAAQRSEI